MSENFWETESAIAVEAPPESEIQQDVESQPEIQAEAEQAAPEADQLEPEAEARALTVSLDDFASLEERILRTVSLVKQERQARMAAEAQAAIADAQVAEAAAQAAQAAAQAAQAEASLNEELDRSRQLKAEVAVLRSEREQVKNRVNKLLEQLDALEL